MSNSIPKGKVLSAGVRVIEIRGQGATSCNREASDVVLVVDLYVVWRHPNDMSTTPVPAPERALRLHTSRELIPEDGLHVGQDITVSARWNGMEWDVERIAPLPVMKREPEPEPQGLRRTWSL